MGFFQEPQKLKDGSGRTSEGDRSSFTVLTEMGRESIILADDGAVLITEVDLRILKFRLATVDF
jgi:hypothetical protein